MKDSNLTAKSNPSVILVCVDINNTSNTALSYACMAAKNGGLAVQILSVIEASYKNLIFGAKALGTDKRKIAEQKIQKLIDMVFKETGIVPIISIREGDISTEIVREVRSTNNCAMLILSKSQNALSDNGVLPKVIKKISDKITIPVLIIPENLDENFLNS